MKTITFLMIFLAQFFCMYPQTTIHIPGDYPTIQAGINASNDGDLVLVADGTYIENINFNGKKITVASHFINNGDFSHIENTTIDGSQPVNPNEASTVLFESGEDTTSKLCGFTITGGSGTVYGPGRIGGGIFIDLANPKICNNIIEDNIISTSAIAIGGGIGIHVESSPILISDNVIRSNLVKSSNSIVSGGGIFIASLSGPAEKEVIIRNNIIENNESSSLSYNDGGGITVNGYDDPNFFAYVISNKIIGNVSDTVINGSTGGGLLLYNTNAYVENNIIAYNAAYRSAGIDNSNLGGNSNIYIINNTICHNSAVLTEGGIRTSRIGEMVNCIVWGNTPDQFTAGSQVLSITYSLIEDPYTGTGNLIGEPFFQDSVYFFMHTDSTVCIDAGNPDPSYNDVEDLMNPGNPMWPALGNLTNDIGHFGGASSLWCYWRWPLSFGLPSAPTLVYPTGLVDTSAVEFSWNMSDPIVLRYWFEISIDNQFTNSFIDSTVTDTTYLYSNLNYGQSYWWRVKAYNAMGWGEFSEVGSIVITDVEDEKQLPDEFNLSQNFPNPFNPSTKINYSVPQSSQVVIKVFDVLGNEIESLVSEEKSAGTYEITWFVKSLPSGIYFYRLQAGDFVQTKKMLLMK